MNKLRGGIIAAALLGLVLLASGCVYFSSVYEVTVNADRSGTVAVTLTMNNSTFELLDLMVQGNTTIAKPLPQYVNDRYFPGFQRNTYNTSSGGVIYVNMMFTMTASNLDDVQYIDLTVSGSELVFQDQRFVGLCDLLLGDPACPQCIYCKDVSVEYKLHMPNDVTTTNADSKTGTLAIWSFNLDDRLNINARCNAPPPTTTTRSPAPTMLVVLVSLGAAAVLLGRKNR